MVNRSAFVARLIQKHAGVSAIDLGPEVAPVTYDMQAAAILNPEQFCKTNGCSPETAARLDSTYLVLHEFLVANSSPYRDASCKVVGPASAEEFLSQRSGGTATHPMSPLDAAAGRRVKAYRGRVRALIRPRKDDTPLFGRRSRNDAVRRLGDEELVPAAVSPCRMRESIWWVRRWRRPVMARIGSRGSS